MSNVGLQRASIFALVKEVNAGDYAKPTLGAQFVPLRPGNTLNFQPEQLESDELLNDIGAAKSFVGKETVEGSHSAYLRHSGVEGQEPELGVLYESIMGSKAIAVSEFVTLAGCTAEILKVADGSNFIAGQALLIKDSANGYSIRNIKSISGNDLVLSFALNAAPSAGVSLGKAITYLPVAQGHPTFSTTKYLGNGYAIESSAGNTATELSLTADANGFGEIEFSYQGTKYFFNPIEIKADNKFLDFESDSGVYAVSIPEGIYKTPIEVAAALDVSMNDIAPESFSVMYSNSAGKFSISSNSVLFSLLLSSGLNSTESIGPVLGFNIVDKIDAQSYTSDSEQVYTSPVSPDYDSADAIIIKGAELLIGSEIDNACICAQTVSMTVSKEVVDVDCICEETGIKEKIANARSVEMSVTAVLNKHDAALLDALLKNKSISASLAAGPKSGGNWLAGRCYNHYLQNCTVASYTTTGDSFIQAEITLRGFVTATGKDLYINFV
jgi:hypothetical protein